MLRALLSLILLVGTALAFDKHMCFDLLRASDYQKAIQLGRELVARNPDSYDAHYCLSWGYFKMGDYKRSLEHALRMEELAEDRESLATAYRAIGESYSWLGDLDRALLYHNRHLTLARELGDRGEESTALHNIAKIFFDKGQYRKALEYYQRSLRLDDDPASRASTLNGIGNVYVQLGNYAEAVRHYREAIEISERIGDYHGAGQTMLNLGNTYRKMRRYAEALRYLTEGLKRVQKVGDKNWEAFGHGLLGWYYLETKDHKKALENFFSAYSIARENEYEDKLYWSLIGMAVATELRPELRSYLEELSQRDQQLFEEMKEKRRTSDFREWFTYYKKQEESQKAKKKKR